MTVQPAWSNELPFTRKAIIQAAAESGIYELLQSAPYPRYRGETRVLKIGMSQGSLRAELRNHFDRHTARNRIQRIEHSGDFVLTFHYIACPSDEAPQLERARLRWFEDEYWDLPVLNSTRGYGRGEDLHYST